MVKMIKHFYESTMFSKDEDFKVEFIRDEYHVNFVEAENIIKENKHDFTEEDLWQIEEDKNSYYESNFWSDTEWLLDNTRSLRWNFYYDKENNEIIFHYWVLKDKNNDEVEDIVHTDEIDTDEELNNDYQKVFNAFIEKEYEGIKETDYIESEWNWDWNTTMKNTDKPDFVIKYRGWEWYSYWFFEYDLVK